MIMKDALLRDRNNMELNEKQNRGWREGTQWSATKAPWNLNPPLWKSFLCAGLLFNHPSCCVSTLLGLVQISTARAVIYGGSSVATCNAGLEGRQTHSLQLRGPTERFWAGEAAHGVPRALPAICASPACWSPTPRAVSLSQRAPRAGDRARGCAMAQVMGLPKLPTSPQKGPLFSAVISPCGQGRWHYCTSVYGTRVQVKVGRVTCRGGRKVPILWLHMDLAPTAPGWKVLLSWKASVGHQS